MTEHTDHDTPEAPPESGGPVDPLVGQSDCDLEPECLICAGEGIVEGRDHLDWDEDGYDDLITCPSCGGTGLAKDMSFC